MKRKQENNNHVDIFQRLAVVETNLDNLHSSVKDITTNHIPHLENSIDELKLQMARYSAGIVVIIAAVEIILRLIK